MIYIYCVRDMKPFAIDCDDVEFVRRMQSVLDANAADPDGGYHLYDSGILQCVFDNVLVPIAEDTCRDAATLWFLVGFESVQAAASDGDCWRDFAVGSWAWVVDCVRRSIC